MKPSLIKKSGLVGNMRGVDMPLPPMLTQPMKELKEIIKARAKVYKPQ
jgi:hypothetical protein